MKSIGSILLVIFRVLSSIAVRKVSHSSSLIFLGTDSNGSIVCPKALVKIRLLSNIQNCQNYQNYPIYHNTKYCRRNWEWDCMFFMSNYFGNIDNFGNFDNFGNIGNFGNVIVLNPWNIKMMNAWSLLNSYC